jgi:hypothetical protein
MKHAFLFAVTVAAAGIATIAGCSSSTTNTPATADAGGGETGTSASALSCEAYCTTLTTNCSGANQQFGAMDRCLASCKAYPVGTAADMAGNTLGCRTYHAGAAKADPVTHCAHAGPGGAGVCGSNCDGYCQLATMYCSAANMAAVYTSEAECKTTCAKFPDTLKFNVTDTTLQEKKEVACLLYHVQEASTAPVDHCLGDLAKGDGGDLSTTCSM